MTSSGMKKTLGIATLALSLAIRSALVSAAEAPTAVAASTAPAQLNLQLFDDQLPAGGLAIRIDDRAAGESNEDGAALLDVAPGSHLLTVLRDGEEVLPGIAAVATYGHTPGHMSFEIGSEAFVIGDAIGNHHVAFEKPQWEAGSDQNPEKAAATRSALIERLASQETAIIGYHLPGGLGRVARKDDAYRFVGAGQ